LIAVKRLIVIIALAGLLFGTTYPASPAAAAGPVVCVDDLPDLGGIIPPTRVGVCFDPTATAGQDCDHELVAPPYGTIGAIDYGDRVEFYFYHSELYKSARPNQGVTYFGSITVNGREVRGISPATEGPGYYFHKSVGPYWQSAAIFDAGATFKLSRGDQIVWRVDTVWADGMSNTYGTMTCTF
jgi:hypothetical protein